MRDLLQKCDVHQSTRGGELDSLDSARILELAHFRCQGKRRSLHSEQFVQAFPLEPHDRLTIDPDNGSRGEPHFFQLLQVGLVFRDIPLLELHPLVRKILLRLVAEHSPGLGVDDHFLGHLLVSSRL